MSINSSSTGNNHSINNNPHVEDTENSSDQPAVSSRLARVFIGATNHNGEQLTTSQLSEKAKHARIAGVVAMTLGIALCIVATALIVGFGFSIIPMAAIFALGLAACLYGAVLSAVAMETIGENDAITQQAQEQAVGEDAEIQQPEALQAQSESNFGAWLTKYNIHSEEDYFLTIDSEISHLSYEVIIELKSYDLSTIPPYFYPIITKKLDALLKSEDLRQIPRGELRHLTKLFLDGFKKDQDEAVNARIKQCYNTLVPHLEEYKMPDMPRPIEVIPAQGLPLEKTVTKLSELRDTSRFDMIESPDGAEYIERLTGIGYKIKENKFLLQRDLRLNAIYSDDNFYNGRFKEHACFQFIEIEGDTPNNTIEVMMYKPIPNAKPLSEGERVPHSTLENLAKLGYYIHNVRLQDFAKVFNPHTDRDDYIPVNAKFIGQKESDTVRSRNIRQAKVVDKDLYENPMNISFTK